MDQKEMILPSLTGRKGLPSCLKLRLFFLDMKWESEQTNQWLNSQPAQNPWRTVEKNL